jgi:hypothetical protein
MYRLCVSAEFHVIKAVVAEAAEVRIKQQVIFSKYFSLAEPNKSS